MANSTQRLKDILVELLNPGREVEDDDTIESLQADSLDTVEVVLALEEDFEIVISDDETAQHVEGTSILEIAEWLDGKVLKP